MLLLILIVSFSIIIITFASFVMWRMLYNFIARGKTPRYIARPLVLGAVTILTNILLCTLAICALEHRDIIDILPKILIIVFVYGCLFSGLVSIMMLLTIDHKFRNDKLRIVHAFRTVIASSVLITIGVYFGPAVKAMLDSLY